MRMIDATEGLVIFVDVAGSTKLYEQHGDIAAYTKISTCLAQLGDIVARFGGVVIKHIGDEVLCLFEDVVAGIRAAIVAQIEMCTLGGDGGLPVRIGCHFGPILVRNEDLYGDTVNIAAHLASMAQAQQILTSQFTLDLYESAQQTHKRTYPLHEYLDFDQPIQFRMLTRFTPKGKQFHIDACVIQWEIFLDEMIADWTFVQPLPKSSEYQLVFNVQGEGYMYKLQNPSEQLVIGRTQGVDIRVNSRNVSRHHGVFAFSSGQVKYTDQSSNGTYIRQGDQPVQFVHRDAVLLFGKGAISFGVSFAEPTITVFQYWFEE